jgi:hypothetical protein
MATIPHLNVTLTDLGDLITMEEHTCHTLIISLDNSVSQFPVTLTLSDCFVHQTFDLTHGFGSFVL